MIRISTLSLFPCPFSSSLAISLFSFPCPFSFYLSISFVIRMIFSSILLELISPAVVIRMRTRTRRIIQIIRI
ncbi:hypothetical protein T492DRAFT_983604 [Pavlovales sp. CCMP2436]|nr:hypothetical protein T492DRAFT_983604 [Pavlovales sp. CCMP2436]